MFGYVVPGRLPVTDGLKQVDANRFVFDIPSPSELKELVFFLIGSMPLPPGHVAALYLSLPPYTAWQYIGCVSNEVPSAICRVLWSQSTRDQVLSQGPTVTAELGISIEQQGIQPPIALEASEYVNFAKVIAVDLFRFLESFSTKADQINVPTSTLDRWLQKFLDKFRRDPNYWLSKDAMSTG